MTRRLLALVVLAVIALGGAACGGSSDGNGNGGVAVLSTQALANIADQTTAKGGVRMSIEQTMSLGSEGTVPSTAEGLFDTRTKRGEMTLSMDLSSLHGAGAPGGAASKQHMIFDGQTLYMSSPLLVDSLPAGKKWLKLDIEEIGKQAGVDLGSLVQGSAGQDPTQVLQYLKAASGDVTKVGTESVRGEPTTHYKATIDFNKLPDAMPADQRAAVRRSIKQIIRLAGTSRAPMEVWIGDDGLVRRFANTITTNIAGERSKISQRVELYDFGAKVDVKIPPARETVDAGDLGGGARETFG